jgi:hypothetical protein
MPACEAMHGAVPGSGLCARCPGTERHKTGKASLLCPLAYQNRSKPALLVAANPAPKDRNKTDSQTQHGAYQTQAVWDCVRGVLVHGKGRDADSFLPVKLS